MPSKPHPLWHLRPKEQQGKRHRVNLHIKRFKSLLYRRRVRIGLTISFYLILCSLAAVWGLPQVAGVSIIPLLLVPSVGYLIYWLVWTEFHQ